MTRWNGREWFVVADSSFYIHNPTELADADLHKILVLPGGEHIRLLFPMAVVDELDGLKESGKHQARWRASHTLGLIDSILDGGTFGILHQAQLNTEAGEVRSEISLEILLDQPGHVRAVSVSLSMAAIRSRNARLASEAGYCGQGAFGDRFFLGGRGQRQEVDWRSLRLQRLAATLADGLPFPATDRRPHWVA
ncbi:hypothetical protein ACWEAF_40850 [Streptomyces sp. NPDC005071]